MCNKEAFDPFEALRARGLWGEAVESKGVEVGLVIAFMECLLGRWCLRLRSSARDGAMYVWWSEWGPRWGVDAVLLGIGLLGRAVVDNVVTRGDNI